VAPATLTAVRRLTILVAAITAVDSMFFAAVAPLLPYYLHHFAMSKSAAGILSAAYAAGALIGALPGGWLAARLGVRTTVLIGLILMVVASVAFAFAHTVAVLDIARFVQGLGGAASWAGSLSWLIQRAPAARRAELIGTTLAAAIAGTMLGPVLGALATVTTPKLMFLLVALAGLGLAAWTWVEDAPPAPGEAGLVAVRRALRSRSVVVGMWLTGLGALLFATVSVLAPLRLDRLGASGVTVGVAFLLAAGAAAATSPFVGRVSDRRGWRAPVIIGLASSALFAALLPLPASAVLVFALVVFADAVFGVVYPPAGALLADGAERVGLDQGYAFSLFNLAWGLGQVLGGAGSAGLSQATSDAIPYAALVVLCLGTLGVIAWERA
jgi:MFS family permease